MNKVEFYILGLLRFDKESVAKGIRSVVLSENQLGQVRRFFNDAFKRINPKERDPWHVWNLSKTEIAKELKETLQKSGIKIYNFICEFGYYHHRIIFKIKFDTCFTNQKFEIIRKARDDLHRKVRELLKKILMNQKIKQDWIFPEVEISYIYTYPLIIIYNGAKAIENQKDRTFSIATTTFFFEVPEVKWGVWLCSHYVRISIPGTIVYASKNIGDSIFWELINGIYYAVLYSKKLQDVKINISGSISGSDEEMNQVDENILRELSSYLLEGIVTVEKQEASVRIASCAIILSLTSIISSLIPHIQHFLYWLRNILGL